MADGTMQDYDDTIKLGINWQSRQVVTVVIKCPLVPRAQVHRMIRKGSSSSDFQNQRKEQKPKGPYSTHICMLV